MAQQQHKKLKFSILQILFWCSYSAFTSFALFLFMDGGLSSASAGFCAASYSICSFCGHLFFNYLCDRLQTNKRIYLLGSVLTYLVCMLLFFVPKVELLMILLYGLLGFVQNPLISNLDSWVIKSFADDPAQYGPIRSWASLATALFMLAYGKIMATFGYNMMLVFCTVFIAITIPAILSTPDSPKTTVLEKKKVSLGPLFASREFLFILFVLLLIGIATSPQFQLMNVILKETNGSLEYQGIAMFFSAILQFPCMLGARQLSRFKPFTRLLFACLLNFISLLLMSMATTPVLIVVASCFGGVAFGISLPAIRQMVVGAAPPQLQSSAQGTGEAFQNALGATISFFMSGIFLQTLGIRTYLQVCATLVVVVAIAIIARNATRRKIAT